MTWHFTEFDCGRSVVPGLDSELNLLFNGLFEGKVRFGGHFWFVLSELVQCCFDVVVDVLCVHLVDHILPVSENMRWENFIDVVLRLHEATSGCLLESGQEVSVELTLCGHI